MEGREVRDQLAAADRHVELNRRLRAAFLRDAELNSLKQRGRGLTDHELRRVITRYPGDVHER